MLTWTHPGEPPRKLAQIQTDFGVASDQNWNDFGNPQLRMGRKRIVLGRR